MLIFNKNVDEIHSFDAQYKEVIFRNNSLVIPYINLGVSNHDLHPSKEGMTYIDYSYVVLRNISYLSIFIENDKRYTIIDSNTNGEVLYFGGEYLDVETKIFNDMQVICEEAYLELLDFSLSSSVLWSFSSKKEVTATLDRVKVNEFYEHKFIPSDILKLIS